VQLINYNAMIIFTRTFSLPNSLNI